jgi:hypothetical protein
MEIEFFIARRAVPSGLKFGKDKNIILKNMDTMQSRQRPEWD